MVLLLARLMEKSFGNIAFTVWRTIDKQTTMMAVEASTVVHVVEASVPYVGSVDLLEGARVVSRRIDVMKTLRWRSAYRFRKREGETYKMTSENMMIRPILRDLEISRMVQTTHGTLATMTISVAML